MKKFTKILLGITLSLTMVITGVLALSVKTNAQAQSALSILGYGTVFTNSNDATAELGTYKQLNSDTQFSGLRLTGKTGASFHLGSVDIGESDWAGTYNATGAPTETDKNESMFEFVFDPHDNEDFTSNTSGGWGELLLLDVTFTQGNESLTVRMNSYSYAGDTQGHEILVSTKAGKQTDLGSYRSNKTALISGGVRRGRIVVADFANLGLTGTTDLFSGSWGSSTTTLPIYYDFNDVALYTPSQYVGQAAGLNNSYLIRDYDSTEVIYNSTTDTVTTWNGFTKDANGSCVVDVTVTFGTVKGNSASSVVITKLGNRDMSTLKESEVKQTVKNVGGTATFGSYKQVTSGEYAGVRLTGSKGSEFNLGTINLSNTYFDDDWSYLKGVGPINASTQTAYNKTNGAFYTGGDAVTDGASALSRSFMSFVYDPSTTANMELTNFTVTLTEVGKPENFVTYHVTGYEEGGVTKEVLVKCTATNNTYVSNERYYKDGITFNHQVRRVIDCRGAQPKPIGLYFDYSQNAAYTDVAYGSNVDGIYRAFRVRDFNDVTNTSNYQDIPNGIANWDGFSKADADVNVTIKFNEVKNASETSLILTSFGGYLFNNQHLAFDEKVKVTENSTVNLNDFAGYKTPTVTVSYTEGEIAKYSVNGSEKFTNPTYTFVGEESYQVNYYDANDVLLGTTLVEISSVSFNAPTVTNGTYAVYRKGSEIDIDNVTTFIEEGDEVRFIFDNNSVTGLPYKDVRSFAFNNESYLFDEHNKCNNSNIPLIYNENGYYSLIITSEILKSAVIDITCYFDTYCDITFVDEYLTENLVYYKWTDETLAFPYNISKYNGMSYGNSNGQKSLIGYARKDIGVDYETKENIIREDGFTYNYTGSGEDSKIGLIYYTNVPLGNTANVNVTSNPEAKKAYAFVPGMKFEILYIEFKVDYAIKIEEDVNGVNDQKSGLRMYVEVDKEDWAKFKFYSKDTNTENKNSTIFYNYITTKSQLENAGVSNYTTIGVNWMTNGNWNPTFGEVNGIGLTCISMNGESYDGAKDVEGAKGAFMFYKLSETLGDMWLDDKYNKNNQTHESYAFVIRNFTDTTQTYVLTSMFSASYVIGGSTSLMQVPIEINLKTVCQEKFDTIVLDDKPTGIYFTFKVNGVQKYSKYTLNHVKWLNDKGGLNNTIETI